MGQYFPGNQVGAQVHRCCAMALLRCEKGTKSSYFGHVFLLWAVSGGIHLHDFAHHQPPHSRSKRTSILNFICGSYTCDNFIYFPLVFLRKPMENCLPGGGPAGPPRKGSLNGRISAEDANKKQYPCSALCRPAGAGGGLPLRTAFPKGTLAAEKIVPYQ